jgi:hypothetical protein
MLMILFQSYLVIVDLFAVSTLKKCSLDVIRLYINPLVRANAQVPSRLY